MARLLCLALVVAAMCLTSASSGAAEPQHARKLLQPAQQQQQAASKTQKQLVKPAKSTATTSSSSSSSGPQTCCDCMCVIPGKDMRSPPCKAQPGCVGMGAPTYGSKNICAPGSNLACAKVCTRDMGSWQAYYEC